MDPLTNLYTRLRRQQASSHAWPEEPPPLEDWLRYWNDEGTELGNLRMFEHWLSCSAPGPSRAGRRRTQC